MKLTLHYRNVTHDNKFVTTETFYNVNKKRIQEIVQACDKQIVKAYVNGQIINIDNF